MRLIFVLSVIAMQFYPVQKGTMKQLTKVEEQIMHIIWQLERCVVRDIIDKLEEPKPPHSTISSVVRILEKKGFVDHKAYGRTYEYFPLITKEAYSRKTLKGLVKDYFGGSVNKLVSFLVKENDMDVQELTEMLEKLDRKEGE